MDLYDEMAEVLNRARQESDKQGKTGYDADAELDLLETAKMHIDMRQGEIRGQPGASEDKDVRG